MLIIFEILFAIWIVSALCSVFLGCVMFLLAIAAHLASYALTCVAVLVDTFCWLWRTAFCDEEGW